MRTTHTHAPFRSELSNSRVVAAVVAGFVPTHVATVTGSWYQGINLPDLGWPQFNGILLLGLEESALAQFWVGTVYHTLTGVAFGLLFAYLIQPMLPIPNSRGGYVLKGIIFGLVLATIRAAWWVPQLFNQVFNFDFGWFSQNLGEFLGVAAWKPIVSIYLWLVNPGFHPGPALQPAPGAHEDLSVTWPRREAQARCNHAGPASTPIWGSSRSEPEAHEPVCPRSECALQESGHHLSDRGERGLV